MKFLEIGTSDKPRWESLLDNGWTGYLVEAHPVTFTKLVERLKDKPDTHFILASVSGIQGFGTFRGFKSDFNKTTISMSLDSSVQYKHKFTTDEKYRGDLPFTVPTITLDNILEHIGYVDKIRIDTEGEEIPILQNYSFKNKPKDLSVEFHGNEEKKKEILKILKENDYHIIHIYKDADGIEEYDFSLEKQKPIITEKLDNTIPNYPEHYKPKDNKLAVSIPIFTQEQSKGAILSAISIINNTDLGDRHVPIYFHIDKPVEDEVSSFLKDYDVPINTMRVINTDPLRNKHIKKSPDGKYLIGLFDPDKINDVVLIVQPDIVFCTIGTRLEIYDKVVNLKQPSPLVTSHYSEYDYHCFIEEITSAAGFSFIDDIVFLDEQKHNAIISVGLDVIENERRTQVDTSILGIPTSHKIISFLKDNLEQSYSSNGLVSLWDTQNTIDLPDELSHDISPENHLLSLQNLLDIPYYDTDKSFENRDTSKDTSGYITRYQDNGE